MGREAEAVRVALGGAAETPELREAISIATRDRALAPAVARADQVMLVAVAGQHPTPVQLTLVGLRARAAPGEILESMQEVAASEERGANVLVQSTPGRRQRYPSAHWFWWEMALWSGGTLQACTRCRRSARTKAVAPML